MYNAKQQLQQAKNENLKPLPTIVQTHLKATLFYR